MLARRCLTGGEHRPALELLGAAAAHAHQVVVIGMGVAGQLEAAAPFGQFQLLEKAHRTEQPQGAVDGGQRHPLTGTQQALVDFLGTEVAALADAFKQGEDPLALGREPLAAVVEAGAQGAGLGAGRLQRHHALPKPRNTRPY